MALTIQDENAATVAGSWSTYGSLGYGGDFAYKQTGSGSDKHTWTFPGLTAGTYNVFATWVPESTNRATGAPYKINGGTAITVNQRIEPTADATEGGRPFKIIGQATVEENETITVELSHYTTAANSYVVADAVAIELASEPSDPPLSICYAGDSNLGSTGAVHEHVTAAIEADYDVTDEVTADSNQTVVSGPLAVSGSQYDEIVALTGIDVVLLNCGAADVLANVSKSDFKTALRSSVDGIGTTLGCPVILCEIAEFLHTYSGNTLSETDFHAALDRIREAMVEVAAESSHVAGLVPMRDVVHASGESFDGVHYSTSPTMRAEFVRRCYEAIVNDNFNTGPNSIDWTKFDAGMALLAEFREDHS